MVSNSDAWSSPCSRCDTLCIFSAYHTAIAWGPAGHCFFHHTTSGTLVGVPALEIETSLEQDEHGSCMMLIDNWTTWMGVMMWFDDWLIICSNQRWILPIYLHVLHEWGAKRDRRDGCIARCHGGHSHSGREFKEGRGDGARAWTACNMKQPSATIIPAWPAWHKMFISIHAFSLGPALAATIWAWLGGPHVLLSSFVEVCNILQSVIHRLFAYIFQHVSNIMFSLQKVKLLAAPGLVRMWNAWLKTWRIKNMFATLDPKVSKDSRIENDWWLLM